MRKRIIPLLIASLLLSSCKEISETETAATTAPIVTTTTAFTSTVTTATASAGTTVSTEITDNIVQTEDIKINREIISDLGLSFNELTEKYGEARGSFNQYTFENGCAIYCWKNGEVYDDITAAGGCNMIDGVKPEDLFIDMVYPISLDEFSEKYGFTIVSSNSEIGMDDCYWTELTHPEFYETSFIFATKEYNILNSDTSIILQEVLDYSERRDNLYKRIDEILSEVKDPEKEWKKAYADILGEMLDSRVCVGSDFDLVYINDDDIPDLVYTNEGNAHFSEPMFIIACGGEMKKLSSLGFGWNSFSFKEREGILRSCISGQGATRYELYKLSEDGAFQLTEEAYESNWYGTYTVQGEDCSILEFNKWLTDSFFTDGYVNLSYMDIISIPDSAKEFSVDFLPYSYSVTEYDINRALKCIGYTG